MPAIRTYSKKAPKVNIDEKIVKNFSFSGDSYFSTEDPFDKLLENPDNASNQVRSKRNNKESNEKLKPLTNIRATYNRNSSIFDDSIVAIKYYDKEQLVKQFTNTRPIYHPDSPDSSGNRTKNDSENAENDEVNDITKVAKGNNNKSTSERNVLNKSHKYSENANSINVDESIVENVIGLTKNSTPIGDKSLTRRETMMQISPITFDVPEITVDDTVTDSGHEFRSRKSKKSSIGAKSSSKKLRPSTSFPKLTIVDDWNNGEKTLVGLHSAPPTTDLNESNRFKNVTQRKSSRISGNKTNAIGSPLSNVSSLYLNVSSPKVRQQHVTLRRSSKIQKPIAVVPRKTKVHFVDLSAALKNSSAEETLDKVSSLIKVSNVYRRKTKNRNNGAKQSNNAGTILDLSTASIQTGKWRRSLIHWRKSQKSLPGKDNPRKSVITRTISLVAGHDSSSILDLTDQESFYGFPSVSPVVEKRRTGKQNTRSYRKISVIEVPDQSIVTYRQPDHRAKVLKRCGQLEPLKFGEVFAAKNVPNCRKIGEGVYGEVFLYKKQGVSNVLKIIPIAGQVQFNGEPQKTFEQILSEIVIAIELSNLRHSAGRKCSTNGFVEVKRVCCVQGCFPDFMVDLWELYRDTAATENDHPEIFDEQQLYIVFELANAGQDLEAFKFENAEQAYSALQQTAVALGVAEQEYQFEHRDLHWGNILLAPTDEDNFTFLLAGQTITIPTHGVKVTIIDFTLSRMVYDGCCLYNDLAHDADLFTAKGDYQFDVYRIMRQQVANIWERYEPFTNVVWLHYVCDKMIDGVRYRLSKSKRHKVAISRMMNLRDQVLNYQSAFHFANSLKV